MKRIVLIILMVITLVPTYVLADSPLDAPVAQSIINTISVEEFVYKGDVLERGGPEVGILVRYYGGNTLQKIDSITITNDVIKISGMHEGTLKKSAGDFADFPVSYRLAPATEILSNINAKVGVYPQATALLYLENVIKVLLGL